MNRTDIHSPASPAFDPQAYDLVDVFDLADHEPRGGAQEFGLAVDELTKQGVAEGSRRYDDGTRVFWGCGHCGQTNIRYAALLVHRAANEWIVTGQDCLIGRFQGQTRESFLQIKRDAELARAKQAKKAAFLALCDANPVLVWATYASNIEIGIERDFADLAGEKVLGYREQQFLGTTPEDHRMAMGTFATATLHDIARKARTYGEASAKQIAFVERLVGEIETKVADYRTKIEARRSAPAVAPLTTGRQVIEGVVLSLKEVDDNYSYTGGTITKVVVKLDGGQRVYGTLPSSIWNAERDDRIRFTAAVETSDDDPAFGFFKRPTKAEILSQVAV